MFKEWKKRVEAQVIKLTDGLATLSDLTDSVFLIDEYKSNSSPEETAARIIKEDGTFAELLEDITVLD